MTEQQENSFTYQINARKSLLINDVNDLTSAIFQLNYYKHTEEKVQ